MSTQRYSVTPHPIDTLLTWVKSGEIAIPEIQRPFVWDATKVRNLLDSLYQGYPVGYLIAWRNPTVRLKDGSPSAGKRILIDGQQRVTALMAALLGIEVLTKNYETLRIRIAFHPIEQRFEVSNPAILKDAAWIPDVAAIFSPTAKLLQITKAYVTANLGVDEDAVFETLERLRMIINNHVGIIELAEDLDIETVTEIFIRVNSAGATLSQADFAMSKIASNLTYGGAQLRKAIDYFCHLVITPDHAARIEKADPAFATTDFWSKIKWLKDANDDLYDPSYTDVLRVAFTSKFGRGKMQDLVALLSGRNFETKVYEDAVAEDSFIKLKEGVLDFVNKTHFDRITMILRSAGLLINGMVSSQNAVNFAYIVYLRGRSEGLKADTIETVVRRWYAMSMLRGRYSASPESQFDFDIRQIETQGVLAFCESVLDAEMSDGFWTTTLPQSLETSSINSPYLHAFKAAQVVLGDKGFLSHAITVRDLLLNRVDHHHIFPRDLLKKQSLPAGRYNQIANFAMAQSEINIAIGNADPIVYFSALKRQVAGGQIAYGGITDGVELAQNMTENCIPEALWKGEGMDYDSFLVERRKLMAARIKLWFEKL
jgi:hypothetical protein